jgi:type II secretory pathway pseudopilin PulG
MRTPHADRLPRRRGITLIELLVVITIVVALFALVAAVAPRMGERQRASRGADQLQGWLLIAKQRALRDQAPRGIRLPQVIGPPANAQYVTQLYYIEQPPAYAPAALDDQGSVVTASLVVESPGPNQPYDLVRLYFVPQPATPAHTIASATVQAALDRAFEALWPSQDQLATPQQIPPDVVLEFYGKYAGQPRRVVQIAKQYSPPGPQAVYGPSLILALDQKFEPNPTYDTPPATPPPQQGAREYRFYRKAQPIAGEPVLQLPKDIAIDISRDGTNSPPTWYRLYPRTGNALYPQPLDILFDKTGQVIGGTGRLGNRICLWVRDTSLADPCPPDTLPPGDNTLITIYTRSGLIAAHPVDPSVDPLDPQGRTRLTPGPTWNPFFFTQDSRSSGL